MDENIIVRLEQEKVVTATFRKLTPQKKEQIYNAALNLFSQEIFDRLSLDELATAAAISKGSLFQYFINKSNIFKFVSAVYIDEYNLFFADYFRNERAVRVTDRIKQYFLALIDYWSKNRVEFEYYLKLLYETDSNLSLEFVDQLRRTELSLIEDIISRGMQTGEIRRDIDSDQVSLALSLLYDGLLKYYAGSITIARRRQYFEMYIDKLISLLFDGIKA